MGKKYTFFRLCKRCGRKFNPHGKTFKTCIPCINLNIKEAVEKRLNGKKRNNKASD